MKKRFILLIIGLSTGISLFFACSQNADSSQNNLQTDADYLLASPEYQTLANEIHQFSNKITYALTSLSPEKQKRIDEICATFPTCKDREKFCTLAEELLSILNIDYNQYLEKTNKLSKNLFKNQKFTVEELTKAIQKRIFLQNTALSTRTETQTPTTSTSWLCTSTENGSNALQR